ncbi:unnamed protein product [Prorocentrum cordatum]|uniref:Uncharacterized protein n=1 Tax=Prorocentrum cordatum TaxID=2364126 RepID=A0ABN9P8H2_9DINO|nr:unnamed protein product [Polarella glacialis]
MCASQIAAHEHAYGTEFDFVLWARPDLVWRFPLGDLRAFSKDHVHASYAQHLELSDLFALVPRRFFDVYAKAYQDLQASGYRFRCLTRADHERASAGKVCDYPGIGHCWRCGFGSIGCLLQHHLIAHGIPLRRIPFEIVDRPDRAREVPLPLRSAKKKVGGNGNGRRRCG